MLFMNQPVIRYWLTDRDVAHIDMQRTVPASPAEQLTFAIEPKADGGVLTLTWDDREYLVPFRVKP